jgi:hypothetical protein
MLASLKAPREPVSFAQAARFRDHGYAPMMIEPGAEVPAGNWLNYRFSDYDADIYGAQMLSLVTGQIHFTVDYDPRTTWLAALRIHTADKHLARDLNALVESHLTWGDGVEQKLSPVRLDNEGVGSLRPFALVPERRPLVTSHQLFEPLRTRRYAMPKDKPRDYGYEGNHVEMFSAVGQFAYTADKERRPYEWTDGGLLAVSRDRLPVLNVGTARALRDDIEALLDARGTRWV